MKIGDYVRTDDGSIGKVVSELYEYKDAGVYDIDFGNNDIDNTYEMYHIIIKSSPNILKLLEPQDLLYVDIDNGFEGGIIVPRIPETLNELNIYINKIESGELILKGVVTHEQLVERMFEVKK